jgi:ATP-dependent phosphofructokinase / diphosphate-dependent phosphofructokinase
MVETLVIAQGGGPTAVINQTLAGAVIETLRRAPGARVLGARFGVRGVRDGNFVDLAAIPEAELRRIAATPGAALGSTRDKPDAAYCEAIIAGLRKAGATRFIYIGGNDTASTLQILDRAADGEIHFVHAPKTIDNDLVENDHTPGFISAAEFVANAFLSIDHDFRAMPGIYVGIVMGRHAGFLTASGAAWTEDEIDGPHLVYVPERPFSVARLIDEIKAVRSRHGRCVVAMSEGVTGIDGRPLVESLVSPDRIERDAHGNVQLSGGDLGLAVQAAVSEAMPGTRVRVDTFGFLPRGFIGIINPTDASEAFAAGAFAAEVAETGSGSVALHHDGRTTLMKRVPLASVAGMTRTMPDAFLDPSASRLSPEGRAYFRRLLPERPETGPALV